MEITKRGLPGRALTLGVTAAFSLWTSVLAQAPMQPGEFVQTQTTASYKLQLNIGPATSPMSGMPMMATIDAGRPVNHRLEVYIQDRTTGAVLTDVIPAVSITDEATAQTRSLDQVMGIYDLQVGNSDLHFGNNVYLPDGSYTITVMAGNQMAQFTHVAVSGGIGLPPAAVIPMAPASPELPIPLGTSSMP